MTSREAAQAALKHWRLNNHRADIAMSLRDMRLNTWSSIEHDLKQTDIPHYVVKIGQSRYLLWGIHAKASMAAVDDIYKKAEAEYRDTDLFTLVERTRNEVARKFSGLPKVKLDNEGEADACNEIYRNFLRTVRFATDKSYLAEGEFMKTLKSLGWDD